MRKIKKLVTMGLAIGAVLMSLAGCSSEDAGNDVAVTQEPEVTASVVPDPTSEPVVTDDVEPTAAVEPTDAPEEVIEPTKELEPTVVPTEEPVVETTVTPEPTATPVPTATPEPTATPVPTEAPKKEVTIDDIKASILKYLSIPRNGLDSVDYAWIDATFTADYAEEMKWSIENFPSNYKEASFYNYQGYVAGFENGGFYMFSEVDTTEDGAKVYEYDAYDSMSNADIMGFVAVYPDGKFDMSDVLEYGYGYGVFTKQYVAAIVEELASEVE